MRKHVLDHQSLGPKCIGRCDLTIHAQTTMDFINEAQNANSKAKSGSFGIFFKLGY